MSEEILINITPSETRVALVENGMLQEVYIERESRRGIVGSIYKGKVLRVLPGMDAAFVDIGLERAAFIHASDIASGDNPAENVPPLPIASLVHEGQSLMVQVIKDPIGNKGARLTTAFSIPARYLVLMPDAKHSGVSQRIEDETERERLRALLDSCRQQDEHTSDYGYIIRTAGEGVGAEEINREVQFLNRLWQSVRERQRTAGAPAVVYEDLGLCVRTLRDLVRPQTEKIRIDSSDGVQQARDFAREFSGDIEQKIEYYPGERPIFDLYGVEEEIEKALSRKVQLKSGGYLVIDQTEAMTTVDVNTGAFVGHHNHEETIFKTNLEAVGAICRQLRLRNLGGIIIIDFIDMTIEEHQRQVMRMFEKTLEQDHARTKITSVSELGLIEMTRKRTTESLGQMMSEACPVCDGRGRLKTPETVCQEVFRELMRVNRAYEANGYMILASQLIVDRLLDEEADHIADLEMFIGKAVKLQVESVYNQEQFDVVPL